jgi:hypothetical protein
MVFRKKKGREERGEEEKRKGRENREQREREKTVVEGQIRAFTQPDTLMVTSTSTQRLRVGKRTILVNGNRATAQCDNPTPLQ